MGSTIAPGELFIERYHIERKLGEGGMCSIYLAWDERLDRRVAIKVLLALADERHRVRFEREAIGVARLKRPNIVAIYDADVVDDLKLKPAWDTRPRRSADRQ